MKFFKLLFLLPLLLSCKGSPGEDAYLEIRYRHPDALFSISIPCPDMSRANGKNEMTMWHDLKLTDKAVLEKFYENYQKLQPDEKEWAHIDTEAGILFHHDNQVDTICINRFGLTVLNGVRQTDNPELFALIRDSIDKDFDPIRKEMHKHLLKN